MSILTFDEKIECRIENPKIDIRKGDLVEWRQEKSGELSLVLIDPYEIEDINGTHEVVDVIHFSNNYVIDQRVQQAYTFVLRVRSRRS